MKKGQIIAAGAVGAGAALFAAGLLGDFGPEIHESQNAKVKEAEVREYRADLNNCIGKIASHNTVKLKVKVGAHVKLGFLKPGFEWKDSYLGKFPTEADFCMKGMAKIATTRTADQAQPLASDTVSVEIDRSKLYMHRPRANAGPPETFKVKNGKVIARDGRKLAQPEPIFADDGKYSSGKYQSFGSDSAKTDALEGVAQTFTFGASDLDIGKDAQTNLNSIGQLEAMQPTCTAAAWEVVGPERLATEAFTTSLVAEGFNQDKIRVSFVPESEWPTPKTIKNEDGRTYDQVHDALENHMSGDLEIESSVRCKTGNLADPSVKSRLG